MTTAVVGKVPKRGKLFYGLAAVSALLTVLCACLVATVILLRAHFEAEELLRVPSETQDHIMAPHDKTRTSSPQRELWEPDFRLPPEVSPLHYDVLLHPDMSAGTFSGEVTITVRVQGTARYIAMHAKELDVSGTRMRVQGSDADLELGNAFEYAPNEMWVVTSRASEGFPAGVYTLQVKFRGRLTDKIVGFYRSVYWDSATNRQRTIATSKFQPTYARQAFPCFDEPSFKSRFSVRLVRPSDDGYSALSNMDVEKEEVDQPAAGLTTVHFKESVPMVTYLACFIVSDFERLAPLIVNPGGVPFSVYATPAQVGKTEYALHTGANITEYYISYFDISYPLPKLDMIAIPDFVSGAMEHWGLITYREVNLLYDSSISSAVNKQRVATVIGHELAHMWFGNLVTLKWWDDLWLNEGFASYMEYKGVHNAHPDWAMMDQFLIDDLHPVLILDAALSSHPIVQSVGHPDEITELFDTISYNKGAAVIRMLENFMGETHFQKGISNFLKAFKYGNAITQDLWDTLQKVVDEQQGQGEYMNITRVMDTWTRQMGFPVLTVTLDTNGNYVLSQSRFLADSNANTTLDVSPYGYKWEVPITYVVPKCDCNVTSPIVWLHADQPSVTIQTPRQVNWIKFNRNQVGYYRVNYTELQWLTFSNLLKSNVEELSSSDRANLLDDVFSLADADLLQYNIALQMTEYLKNEKDYAPWSVASTKINTLKRLLSSSSAYPKLRAYVRNLIETAYDNVTLTVSESDSHLQRRLRVTVLDLACGMGLEKCLQAVNHEFTKWIANPENRPSPDLRSIIYEYGTSLSGNEQNWDLLWNLYLSEGNAQEKAKLSAGLAATHEPWLLQRFIQNAKNESNVRSQDFFSVLTAISNNPVGSPIVWEFIRSEWEYLVDRFTLNNRYLGNVIPAVTKSFATPFKLREMETFFEQYPDAGAGKMARSQALETVANNIRWRQLHEATLDNWLSVKLASG